ncbi:MAG: DUF4159 domain-containing protein [Pirellulales bacterium]|nr:DUF4159 domain-containing protein [Pirellulales bacterium]
MRHTAVYLAIAAILVGSITPILKAQITADQIRTALEGGSRYLKGKQKADGSWPDPMGYPGGITGLCTLALLHAGATPEDEHVRRALGWLRANALTKTYTVSLQTMVFCRAEPDKDLPLIQRNVDWIERNQIVDEPTKGCWSYPGHRIGDNSNTQFALLALHEAQRAGANVHERTWRLAKTYWENCQNPDGSWSYQKKLRGSGGSGPSTGSMTCAGIASMIIINDAVGQPDATVADGHVQCCRPHVPDNDAAEKGFQWLARNFSVTRNPGQTGDDYALYYLYAVERVGRMTAERFIGRHDWYREGADHLIHWYRDDSRPPRGGHVVVPDSWVGRGHAETNDLVATSFAMLFLSKGRRPVLLAKAQHRPGDDWNQHRHDVANLTRYVESKWRRDMTWQIVDLDLADVDDLVQSPVIYYSGSRNPLPKSEADRQRLAQKLRGYLDRGKFLLAEAGCGGREFDKGFRDLMRRVFPERAYQLRLLDASHPIWRAEEPVKPEHLRPLLGIDFGCRTSVVYAPPDPPDSPRPSLSCLWELSQPGRGTTYPAPVQAQIDAARALGINILAYATNRELQYKDEIPAVLARSNRDALAERGQLAVAKLRHPGGCNAAPLALVHLLEQAESELKLRTVAEERLINLTDDSLFDYHLVLMHGRTAFRLTRAERKRLRLYVERGGTVLADSICASKAFTESFRREMAAIFPDKPLARIAPNDPMLTTAYGGYDLKTVTRNDPQASDRKQPIRSTKRKVAPALEGIRWDNRWRVIFSPYDISCALEKHNSLECQGYPHDDAARIALNVLLYSLQRADGNQAPAGRFNRAAGPDR